MFNTPELFFDMWQIMDSPQMFPFFKQNQIDSNTLIIQNTLNPNVDNYIYLSDKEPDFEKISDSTNNKIAVISYYTKLNNSKAVGVNGCRLINSSVIYKSKVCMLFSENSEFIVESATTEDCSALPSSDDENAHDYIGQIKCAITDKSGEVYVLKVNKLPVCFMILTDALSEKFSMNCKCISVVYTLFQHRKQGYAEILMKHVMNKYKDKAFLYVADSDKNLASNNLALACGFEVVGYNYQVEINNGELPC